MHLFLKRHYEAVELKQNHTQYMKGRYSGFILVRINNLSLCFCLYFSSYLPAELRFVYT